MKRVHVIISGHVQGVYFRQFVKDRAEELGLTGYTKNINTRSVEIVAEGHEVKLNSLVENCKKGPNGSYVEEIKVTSLPYTGEFKQFRIKY